VAREFVWYNSNGISDAQVSAIYTPLPLSKASFVSLVY
jgi:hypothetical protein